MTSRWLLVSSADSTKVRTSPITGLGYVRDGQTGSHPTTTVAQVPLTLERTPTKVGSPRSVARSARCTPRLDRHLPTESPCGGGGLPPHFWAFAHCVQECPSTFARDWHEVAVGVKFLSPISSIASNVSTLEEGNPLLHKANGGARGIRTLDPSYPGYRISSSHSARPPTSVVVHPELNGRTIDALTSSGIRPRPARWGSWWGSENTRVGSNPSALVPGAATPRSPPAVQRWGRAVARPLAEAGRLRGRTGVKLPCAHRAGLPEESEGCSPATRSASAA
jgi:hypothetical protein